MREIKFRAWHKDAKKMFEVLILGDDYIEAKCTSQPMLIEHVELMQYTGLKDKNGVEIYEGDIVAGDGKSIFSVNGTGFIAWCAGSFVNKVGDKNYVFHEMSALSLKVIGNIHQNPELLD